MGQRAQFFFQIRLNFQLKFGHFVMKMCHARQSLQPSKLEFQ
jgi:hypothetical protein